MLLRPNVTRPNVFRRKCTRRNVTSSLFGLDQQVKPVQPNTSFTDPWSTETLCSTLCIKEKENNIRAEEAAQNPETN